MTVISQKIVYKKTRTLTVLVFHLSIYKSNQIGGDYHNLKERSKKNTPNLCIQTKSAATKQHPMEISKDVFKDENMRMDF
ncbi:MAG: hypothetical protein AVO38_06015 [delta proteobacterium ML8_D]|jgi:hypothetical protein|nr:MAG: hypothetical protein AVO38_06015 [delta proteobacterium ML8_D]